MSTTDDYNVAQEQEGQEKWLRQSTESEEFVLDFLYLTLYMASEGW
jgi:hypothetical protein